MYADEVAGFYSAGFYCFIALNVLSGTHFAAPPASSR